MAYEPKCSLCRFSSEPPCPHHWDPPAKEVAVPKSPNEWIKVKWSMNGKFYSKHFRNLNKVHEELSKIQASGAILEEVRLVRV